MFANRTRRGLSLSRVFFNPRFHELAQRPVGRYLVELKRPGALFACRRERGVSGGAVGGCVCGLPRLAAGVAVLRGDPFAERLPLVRRAAGSHSWIGHGSHSNRADERGRDWRRKRDALDVEGRRPDGLGRRGEIVGSVHDSRVSAEACADDSRGEGGEENDSQSLQAYPQSLQDYP